MGEILKFVRGCLDDIVMKGINSDQMKTCGLDSQMSQLKDVRMLRC